MDVEKRKIYAEQIPIVRITMDSMKQTMMQMLDIEKLRPHIEQRLNDAIRAFDCEGEVEKAAGSCISECVQNWFRYGDGNDLIQRAVSVALEESLSGLIKKINKKRNHGR
jgi:hypothetical protein